jgi:hypothetical protein
LVSGGRNNSATNSDSTIGGGVLNCVTTAQSTVSGGYCNWIILGRSSFIGGGGCNSTSNDFSTISGGYCNTTEATYSTIVGGCRNTNTHSKSIIIGSDISTNRSCTTFVNDLSVCSFTGSSGCNVGISSNGLLIPVAASSGGAGIIITGTGVNSTIRCGVSNTASSCFSASLAGSGNTVSGSFSSVVGGQNNILSGSTSFIGGGQCNTIGGSCSSILGGQCNTISSGFTNSNIIGSNITANRTCTTFVNDLSVCSFTGSSGCTVGVSTNGLLIPGVSLDTKIAKDDGPTYDTNAIKTVTAAEYAAIVTKDPSTLYFII